MPSLKPETYHVAMKAFVRNGDSILICHDALQHKWDLPGGRIGIGEFDVPLEEILKREIEEELGSEIKWRCNGPVAIFRHRRPEISAEGKPEVRILMIGFEVDYLGGPIILSDEHSEYRWVAPREAVTLLPGGQADGMAKYIRFIESRNTGIVY